MPQSAVVERLDAAGQPVEGVFVVTEEEARFRQVDVIGREGDQAAITGDLTAGERVIVRGHGDLSDGAKVRVAEEGG